MATVHAPVVSSHPFRFSIVSLLAIMAAVAVILTPAHWFGAAYLVSIGLSTALVISCAIAYSKHAYGVVAGLSLVGAFGGFVIAMVLMVYFMHAVLNLLLCIVLAVLPVRFRTFAVMTVGLTVVLYGLVIWAGVGKVRALAGAKRRFPIVSLAERLAFEQDARQLSKRSTAPARLTPAVAAHLNEQEGYRQYSRYRSRSWSLEELHENVEAHFARSAGFGVSRMQGIYPEVVELAPREKFIPPVPLRIESLTPGRGELYPMHQAAVIDFFDSNRIGYVPSRLKASGFESHGFSALQDRLKEPSRVTERWQVSRLELVSLLRHDEPRVYVAESLPQMNELAEVPHRALNEFEAGALPQLVNTLDIVVVQDSGRIQMLGSLRADTNCLQCHDGNRGKLLGAFSYEITPIVHSSQTAASSPRYPTAGM